jgi:acylphosphatase
MRLKITGYAKNLANTDVEILACGDSVALQELRLWLHDGPPMAKVTDVIEQPAKYESHESFQIS